MDQIKIRIKCRSQHIHKHRSNLLMLSQFVYGLIYISCMRTEYSLFFPMASPLNITQLLLLSATNSLALWEPKSTLIINPTPFTDMLLRFQTLTELQRATNSLTAQFSTERKTCCVRMSCRSVCFSFRPCSLKLNINCQNFQAAHSGSACDCF